MLSDGDKSYTYDLNGSQISSIDLATSQTTNFQFNVRNRLQRVDFLDGTNNTMNYYPLSSLRRSLTTKAADTTKYFWEGGNVVEEIAGDNTHKCWYLEGPGLDAHIARVSSAGTNYYVRDPLNTVRQVVSQAGVTQNSYTYKAFGQVRDAQESVTNPYRFTERRWEPDTGLHYFRARYFSGSGGRFIATDAFAPWKHSYGYGNGSPYRFVDPLGFEALPLKGKMAAIMAKIAEGKTLKQAIEALGITIGADGTYISNGARWRYFNNPRKGCEGK